MKARLILLAAFSLCACQRIPVKPMATPPIGQDADTTRIVERATIDERDSQTVAALKSLENRVPELSDSAWRAELGLILARYGNVKPKAAHVEQAKARVDLWTSGREEEAKVQIAAETAKADAFVSRFLVEKKAREDAEAREVASRLASKKEHARLTKELDDAKNKTNRIIVLSVAGVSIALIALSAAYIIFSPNKLGAARTACPVFVLGILGIGLSRLLAHPWFMPACAVVAVIAVIAVVYSAWSKHKEGKLQKEVAEQAQFAKRVAGDLVEGIEEIRGGLKKKGRITKGETDKILKEYVTGYDNTAPYVDALRRERKLIQ